MFFQTDDRFWCHPKPQALARLAMNDDLSGPAAIGLWNQAGSMVQDQLTDGLVSLENIVSLYLNREVALLLAGRLVSVDLWHDDHSDCETCEPTPPGYYRFHDWWDMKYDSGEKIKITRAKRAEIQKRSITDAVWLRDRLGEPRPGASEEAYCRYCGNLVRRRDNRGQYRWAYDHVDPNLALGARNIVVACKGCNDKKGNHVPAQRGMCLYPPRTSAAEIRSGRVNPVGLMGPDRLMGPDADSVSAPMASDLTASSLAATTDEAVESGEVIPGSQVAPLSALKEPEAGSPLVSDERPSGDAADDACAVEVPSAASDDLRVGSRASPDLPIATDFLVAATAESVAATEKPVAATVSDTVLARARASGYGLDTGLLVNGLGHGYGNGDGRGKAPPGQAVASRAGRRSNQKRRRKRTEPLPGLDAGECPEVEVPGRFGSPWYQWRGDEKTTDDAVVCEAHSLPMPCRRCWAENGTG